QLTLNLTNHFFQSCLCSNVSCYRIEPGTMAGIISADLMLTLLIVGITYKYASYRRQKVDNADKIYMNVRANIKNKE
uniref:Hematopoietic cell signal transducer n=1 Tax=Cyprinodon variegatus TaxID=28743 RepID=A0A3Q2CMP9_CYPVA